MNISDEIKRIKRAIEYRLVRFNSELEDRAEQLNYTTHPMTSLEHKASAARGAKMAEATALKEFNKIKKLHEELFEAELELEKANR